jgi:hypothetical protein
MHNSFKYKVWETMVMSIFDDLFNPPMSQVEQSALFREHDRHSNSVHQKWLNRELEQIKERLDALEAAND